MTNLERLNQIDITNVNKDLYDWIGGIIALYDRGCYYTKENILYYLNSEYKDYGYGEEWNNEDQADI